MSIHFNIFLGLADRDRRSEVGGRNHLVAELLKRLYGAKSKKADTAQLLLDLLGDEPKKTTPVP